jgi:tetratricopeptide (TPR) repeat protein
VETINGMEDLASAYQAAKKYPEAEAMQTQSIELRRKVQGPENVETLRAMGALANIERAEGKYAPAEALLGQILEIRRRVLGPDHRDTLVTSVRLADSYYFQGNYAQASAVYSQSLESARRVLAPGDPLMLGILENLGSTLSHQGQYDEADQLFREAILNTGPAQQQTLWYNFACAAAVAGRKDAALDYLSQAIDRGFDDADTMGHDDDLKSLRGDARFDALVARASRAAAAPQR